MHYNVSDYIDPNYVGYTIYDGHQCSSGANNITDAGYFSVQILSDSTAIGDGWGTRQITLATTINPANITKSNVYVPDGSDAYLKFCVRFSLYNNYPYYADSVEINFLETQVTLWVNLVDGFSITGNIVQEKQAAEKTAYDAFYVESFLCDQNNIEISVIQPFTQGSIVRVCVRPTFQAVASGGYMRAIDDFHFYRGQISQDAVVDGMPSSDGLTDVNCQPGSLVCSFETLLYAYFFRVAGLVSGEGTATLQFGAASSSRRYLRNLGADSVGQSRKISIPDFKVQFVDGPPLAAAQLKSCRLLAFLLTLIVALALIVC